jgi:hypothetical protein
MTFFGVPLPSLIIGSAWSAIGVGEGVMVGGTDDGALVSVGVLLCVGVRLGVCEIIGEGSNVIGVGDASIELQDEIIPIAKTTKKIICFEFFMKFLTPFREME